MAMITAATWMPPAAVCMDWNMRSMQMETREAYQGTNLSMRRPPSGPIDTPAMPINPKRPITSLMGKYMSVNEEFKFRIL